MARFGFLQQTTASPPPQAVYLDLLLGAPSTQQMGYRPYRPYAAFIEGTRYARSLLAEATNNTLPTARYSSMAVALGGRYQRFQATLGRDDKEQTFGPGYCIFEVWADDRKLFRSEAIRSSLTPIVVEGVFPKRSRPQEIDLPIDGVQTLRLVTRFAYEFTQRARYVNRAFGCVWGNARVLLTPDAAQTVENPFWQASLRRAALRLVPSLPKSPTPLRLVIAPLRVEAQVPDSPLRHGETEAGMRGYLADTLGTIRQGPGPLVKPLDGPKAMALAEALRPNAPARADAAKSVALARQNGADLLVFGAVEPSAGQWRVVLRLLDARRPPGSATLAQITVPVGPDSGER